MEIIPNPQLKLAFDFLEYTDRNVFLTGKAGTGKNTFLHGLRKRSMKRMVVVAPTGVAAINAGGVTVHSFFQISFGPQIPTDNNDLINKPAGTQLQNPGAEIKKFNRNKIDLIKALDLLVIDEISMVRADLLDAIDRVLRRFKNRYKPFGGVQLLMIGDLQQLAPVVKEHEWEILKNYYTTSFFFGSRALQKTNFISIELKHIYRQKDDKFIEILNKIRDNKLDKATMDELNKRYIPGYSSNAEEGYIILTTHNAQAHKINETKLNKLDTKSFSFKATVEGEFPEYSYPTDFELTLKKGAQVMFVKNDASPEKQYYNGKIGKITEISEGIVSVECPGDREPILIQAVEWENMKYSLEEATALVEETIIGKFIQHPLKLAWAITIHKSQGLTFDKAVIDANLAFAHGQVYVALSRCKTLDGMILNSPLSQRGIISDSTISSFNRETEQNQPNEELLNQSKKNYNKILLLELFDFRSIQNQIFYFEKILKEHDENVFIDNRDRLFQMGNLFKKEVTEVSIKFENQVNNLIIQHENIEENTNLQERVMKACQYFKEKTQFILKDVIAGIDLDSDNKTIRKLFKDAIGRLEDNILSKLSCLDACKNGFKITNYLEARALSSVIKTMGKEKEKKPSESISGSITHPKLYSKLKSWRNGLADEANLPVYIILPQKTLVEISNTIPQSLKSLKKIKGFGKKKISFYGKEILSIIEKYCIESQIGFQGEESDILEEDEKPVKENTKEISLRLFREGKTIEEVARERKMAVTTIEGHIAHFIGTGELKIDQFVTPEKTTLISGYFLESENHLLSEAKQILGDDISYAELKYVLKHLEYSENL